VHARACKQASWQEKTKRQYKERKKEKGLTKKAIDKKAKKRQAICG